MFSLMRAGIRPGSLGKFGEKQVHVLARATANIESALAGGSQAIFRPDNREIQSRDRYRHIYR